MSPIMNQEQKRDFIHTLFEHAAASIAVVHTDGTMVMFNRAFSDFVGYSKEELLRINIFDITFPEDQELTAAKFREGEELNNVTFQYEKRYLRKDGKVVWGLVSGSWVSDGTGTPLGVALIQDITARKESERALRESEELYRTLVENIDLGINLISDDRRILMVNQATSRILDKPSESFMGKECFREFEKRDKVCEHCPGTQAMATGKPAMVLTEGVRDNGARVVIRLQTFPVPDADGNFSKFVEVAEDITEQVEARDALQEKEQRFRTIFENAAAGIYTISPECRFLQANQALCRILGYREDELLKLSLEDVTHADDLDMTRRIIQDSLSNLPAIWHYEKRYQHKNGTVLWAHVSGAWQFDETGRPTYGIGMVQDITELKNAEVSLQEKDRFIEAVLNNLPIGIAVNSVDPKVTFEYMNDKFPKYYRVSRKALNNPGKFWETVYEDPEFRDRMRNKVLEDCASGDPKRMVWEDVPITRKGEETTYITARNIPLTENNLMISTVWDVTERKRSEAERDRLLSAIEQAGEMIVITDPEGNIQYVNPAFEQTTGYQREEIVGENPRILKSGHQNDMFYRNLWGTLASGKVYKERIVNKSKDGSLFTVAVTISPVFDAVGRIVNYVSVERDITERLHLEAQFQQAQKMESIGRLAGGVAHDYNNMLSVIFGYAEMAMRKVDEKEPLFADLQQILKAADRSAAITRQLLAFARKQTILPQVLVLNDTVENMLSMLRRLIGEDIDLLWKPGKTRWPVKMDPSQLDQILANLCVNARDAINGVGKVTIETGRTSFDAAYCFDHPGFLPGDYVLLAVSDDGCGMDRETMKNIFEPFYSTKGENQGTGLGLAIVYGIVKQNNGFINVYSEPGNGTTIKIYLPPHEGDVSRETPERPTDLPLGCGETILLVDDDQMVSALGQKMLESLGYQVMTANTPTEALRLAGDHAGNIHLVITDVIMPEMNGRDLSDQLLKLYPDLKILFMSGYTASVISHRGVLADGVNYLQKPFPLMSLARKVRAALRDSA